MRRRPVLPEVLRRRISVRWEPPADRECPRLGRDRTAGRRHRDEFPCHPRGAGNHRDTRRPPGIRRAYRSRSEEHTSELQSLMRISYAVFCLKKKTNTKKQKKKNKKQQQTQTIT